MMPLMGHSYGNPSAIEIALLAEIERLRAALLQYGLHDTLCSVGADTPCDCGFSELSKSLVSSE